jgi:hypothetical protein
MAKEIPGQCAHEACRCDVGTNERYCSEHCAMQDAKPGEHSAEGGCNCGHPACQSDG